MPPSLTRAARRLAPLCAAAACLAAGLLCWSAPREVDAAEPAADDWERIQFDAKGLPQSGAGADAYDLYRARVPEGWLVVGDDGGVNGVVHVPDPEHAWKPSESVRWETRRAKGLKRSIPPQLRNNPQLRKRFAGPFTLLRTRVPTGWLVRFGPNRVRFVPDDRGRWK